MSAVQAGSAPADAVYVIDCDTGIDDSLALGYMLAQRADRLLAVTTVFGNVSVAQGTRNTLDLLAVAGHADVPVHAGAATSLDGVFAGTAHRVHGLDGFGGVELPRSPVVAAPESAPAALVRLAHEHAGRLVVVAMGPLTNLALALTMNPSIVALIHEVVVMGGAVQHAGNATPVAEANIWHDPEAAQRVLTSGLRVRLLPLDATMRQRLSAADADSLEAAPGRTPRLIGGALRHYLDFYTGVFGSAECALHDPLAVALALGDERAVDEAHAPVEVVLSAGPTRGMTVTDLRTRYRGSVSLGEARHTVVLRTEDGFGERLRKALTTLS